MILLTDSENSRIAAIMNWEKYITVQLEQELYMVAAVTLDLNYSCKLNYDNCSQHIHIFHLYAATHMSLLLRDQFDAHESFTPLACYYLLTQLPSE